jgi:hypothetical protein
MLRLWDLESRRELDSILVDGGILSVILRGDSVLVGNNNSTITGYRLK